MLGAGLQFNRSRGEDRFYSPAKARKNRQQNQRSNNNSQQLQRAQSDAAVIGRYDTVKSVSKEQEKVKEGKVEEAEAAMVNPGVVPDWKPQADRSLCNLERFLASITPSVNAQYLSKMTMRGWRTCDVEFQPYFVLGDLWESFKEWSAYGAGVPIVLDGTDSVVQYYVPYLSAIQIYVDLSKSPVKSRRASEDSDGDSFGRDSSSDGSSDSEREPGLAHCRGLQDQYLRTGNFSLKMERLSLEEQQMLLDGGYLNDDSESGNAQNYLLFEYLERALPFIREPLADKISDLAVHFPDLKTLRSCDVLPSSWFSVAWYSIYRIPTGPTLKDLDACFLTYHSLHTPVGDITGAARAPVLSYPDGVDGVPKIALPVFGLASYKFRGALWTPNGGSDRTLVNSLFQAADNWVRSLRVEHPDFQFFRHRS